MVDRLIPKETPDTDWERLVAFKPYAVLCSEDQYIYIKIGAGRSFYLSVSTFKGDYRVMNSLQYDSGDESLLFKIPPKSMMILGRSVDSTIKIMHSIVSRKHAEIFLDGNILVIRDLGSTNGTYVYKENIYFSIEDYLEHHPLDQTASETLDEVHQMFGPELDDFLRFFISHKQSEPLESNIVNKSEQKEEENHEPSNHNQPIGDIASSEEKKPL